MAFSAGNDPTGFGAMIQMVSNKTILQTIVDDDKQGANASEGD